MINLRSFSDSFLADLATNTRYSLEDLDKAHYLIRSKEGLEKYIKIAQATGEPTIYGYISRLIALGYIPIPKHLRLS